MVKIPAMGDSDTFDQIVIAALQKPAATVVAESGAVTTIEPKMAEKQSTAGKKPTRAKADAKLPWENANPRIISFVQVRMPEPLKLQLEWLDSRNFAQKIGLKRKGQHQIILAILEREVARLVAKELKDDESE